MLALSIFKNYFLSKRSGALIRSLARLCLIGNFVGVTALVLVLSIMNGFNRSQSERLLSVEPHLIIFGARAESAFFEWLDQNSDTFSRDEVIEASLFEQQDVILKTIDGVFSGAIAKGLLPGPLTRLLNDESQNVEKLGAGEVLLGSGLAAELGLFVGDELTLVAPETLVLPSGEIPPISKVRVQGLLSTGLPVVDSQGIFYDKNLSLGAFKNATTFKTGIEVRLSDPHRAEFLLEKLRENRFEAESWIERNSALFFALKMEKYAMGAFLILTLLITSFSLITVLVMLLTQKRKEIGLLMALGLSKKRALVLFQSIGFILASSGMFFGLLFGLFLSSLLQYIRLPLLPDIYTDPTLPALIDWVQIFYISLGLAVLAFLSSWLPVRGSLELTPSQALRLKN